MRVELATSFCNKSFLLAEEVIQIIANPAKMCRLVFLGSESDALKSFIDRGDLFSDFLKSLNSLDFKP